MSSRRRKLTPFLAQEMLFDYATDQLDAERRAAVSEFLATDRETRDALARLERALKYCQTLSETEPANEVIERLRGAENVATIGHRYSSFGQWPEVLRWATYCVLLVICTAGVVSAVPWKRLAILGAHRPNDGTFEVAAIATPSPTQVFANTETNGEDTQAPESSGDEEIEDAGDDVEDAPPAPQPSRSAAAVASSKVAQKPTPTPTPEPAPTKSKTGNAFVYRAFMTLPNVDDRAQQITADIIALGGKKAHEAELGWQRGTGRYYHFALPEANEQKLLEKLRAYGPVRISKDPHSRIMPPGQVRFILWVESGK